MKAFRAEADWSPRPGYTPSAREEKTRWIAAGNRVWRNPRLGIAEAKEPQARDDELLLRVRYCGICGSDSHVYESDAEGYIIFSGPARLPCILGHEYTGEVVEVGRGVEGFERGDIVTGESVLWCGTCQACREGMPNQCENIELMGLTVDGAFAEYMAVKARYCWKLNSLDARYSREEILRVGALVEPLGCAYNGIFISGGGVRPGAYAIVYGAGPIGLGAVSLLRAAGAAKVIAIDVVDERLALASALGADAVLNPLGEENLVDALLGLTEGRGADIQVDAAGAANRTLPVIDRLFARRGKLIYLARAESVGTFDLNRVVSGALSIIGARGHSGYGIFPSVIRLLQGGRLPGVEGMVTSVYAFDDITRAFESLRNRKDAKVLVKI